MTEAEALTRCIMIWMWLALYPGRTKEQAYEYFGFKPDLYFCPLCEYTSKLSKPSIYHVSVNKCPLYGKWGHNKYGGCAETGNYYNVWGLDFIDYKESRFLKRYYAWKMRCSALKIVCACVCRLKEVKGGMNG